MQVDEKEVISEIKKIISKVARINLSEIKENSSLRDEFLIDSLQAIQIASIIEEKFDIKFDEIEIFNVDSVKEINELVLEYINSQNNS